MNLREYLFYSGMSVREFAKLADFNEAFLCGVMKGNRIPSAKTLRAIERVTKGKVTAETACAPIKLPENWEQ